MKKRKRRRSSYVSFFVEHRSRQRTTRMPTCPSSSLIYKKGTKRKERKPRTNEKEEKNEQNVKERIRVTGVSFDRNRSGLKVLPNRLLFSFGSPLNPRFVSLQTASKDQRNVFLPLDRTGKRCLLPYRTRRTLSSRKRKGKVNARG